MRLPLFFRAFLENPREVSSVIPTSRFAVRRISEKIDGSMRKVIMEYGPGTGVVSKALLAPGKLTDDSRLILVEKSKLLVDHLRSTITDKRVSIYHDSAVRAADILRECGETQANHILLSIPLSKMASETRTQILSVSHDVLHDDGSLIAFLVYHATPDYLRSAFDNVDVQREWLNFPPLLLMEAKKNA
jgi:phospholipid N-methyltransferase